MEIVREIQSWIYPAVDSFLLIFCLVRIRNHGGKFFATGFGVLLTTSLMWRFANIFDLHSKYDGIYELLGHINFFSYIIFAGLFVAGIIQISGLTSIQKEKTMQGDSGKMSLTQILFSFTGRIGRGTFWAIWLSMLAASFIIGLLIGAISSSSGEEAGLVLYFLYLIPAIWIGLAMQVKRWHDRDKSGWMVLINFIPIIGIIWALVELGFLQGTIGPNQYGNDPLPSIEKAGEEVAP